MKILLTIIKKVLNEIKIRVINFYCQIIRTLKFNKSIEKLIGIESSYKCSNDNYIIFDCIWDNALHWYKIALFKNTLCKFHNAKSIAIQTKNSLFLNFTINKLFFDKKILVKYEGINKKKFHLSKKYYNSNDILSLSLPYNYPSYLLYDFILKKERIGKIEKLNKNQLSKYVEKIIFYLNYFNQLIDRYDIKTAFLSHKIGIELSALAWILVCKNKKFYLANYYNRHVTISMFNKINFSSINDDYLKYKNFLNLSDEKKFQLENYGNIYLTKISQGKEGHFTKFNVYKKNNSIRSKNDFNKVIGNKKNLKVFSIMCNAWPDFPNMYKKNIFNDYVDWCLFTFKVIQKNNNVFWLFKAHPAELAYGAKTKLNNLISDRENIKILDKNILSNDVLKHTDGIVTARGTSAIEYAARGKTVITCFDSPYKEYNFTYHANSKKKYTELIRNCHNFPYLNPNFIKLAKIFASSFLSDLYLTKYPNYPYGDISYLLYLNFHKFIKLNKKKIINEKNMFDKWIKSYNQYSSMTSYNEFKIINSK